MIGDSWSSPTRKFAALLGAAGLARRGTHCLALASLLGRRGGREAQVVATHVLRKQVLGRPIAGQIEVWQLYIVFLQATSKLSRFL